MSEQSRDRQTRQEERSWTSCSKWSVSQSRACTPTAMLLTLKQCSRASRTSLSRYFTTRTYYTRTPSPPSAEFTRLLGSFASLPPRPTPLSSLLASREPLTPRSLLLSASYVWEELPRRTSRRVKALDALPFIVGMNPFIARHHELYRNTFESLATAPPITDLDSNWEFVKRLETLVRAHANDVPTLARG
jgi:26S proteasome regulatory subunit T1